MKKYEKPVVMINEELAEGVYAASGCFSITPNIHQTPETGRGTYVINFDSTHLETHETNTLLFTVVFNQSVKYLSSAQGSYIVGAKEGTTLTIKYDGTHYVNATKGQGVGLGDVSVESDEGLSITSSKLECIDCLN